MLNGYRIGLSHIAPLQFELRLERFLHGGWTADPFASTWTSRVRPFDFVTMKGIVIGRWPIGRGKRRPYLRGTRGRRGGPGRTDRGHTTPDPSTSLRTEESAPHSNSLRGSEGGQGAPHQVLRLGSGRRRARHPLTPSEPRRENSRTHHPRSFPSAALIAASSGNALRPRQNGKSSEPGGRA